VEFFWNMKKLAKDLIPVMNLVSDLSLRSPSAFGPISGSLAQQAKHQPWCFAPGLMITHFACKASEEVPEPRARASAQGRLARTSS